MQDYTLPRKDLKTLISHLEVLCKQEVKAKQSFKLLEH